MNIWTTIKDHSIIGSTDHFPTEGDAHVIFEYELRDNIWHLIDQDCIPYDIMPSAFPDSECTTVLAQAVSDLVKAEEEFSQEYE